MVYASIPGLGTIYVRIPEMNKDLDLIPAIF